jgi:alkylhydroperoxidase family enzyme
MRPKAGPARFDEPQLVRLTLAIAQINTWNRIAIAFRDELDRYQPQTHRAAAELV